MTIDRQRLDRIRNFQSQDWWAMVFARPAAILLLLACADWKWVTPNLLTLLAFLTRMAACALIAVMPVDYSLVWAIGITVILQVSLVLDNADGTLARYRGICTSFGSFVDKSLDVVGFFFLFGALGFVVYRETGELFYPVAGVVIAFDLLFMGYLKWVTLYECLARKKPSAGTAARADDLPETRITPPPSRTRREWLIWFLKANTKIVLFEEVDFFFWISLGLLVRHVDWVIWLLLVTQTFIAIAMIFKRGRTLWRLDKGT